ncbi:MULTISPECIES: hypothetical protein [unclassified Tolypothrix]|uniref:hypothetical protein n=1 Tax=unclassified Tolypothrix TaxID=2649714 RepID=UPI0005EABE1E|nr:MULTISPECIES: hypothetical protein [unclassified Tolypothrix]EKF01806.1 hypothetical protein FDUTEX481_07411 [Tolypothrix sp. PCC 7601]UYD34028.1 hypothetical protein HG267_35015 [Tolypothrix sp. PCC 7601]
MTHHSAILPVKRFEPKIGFGEKVKGFFFPFFHSPFSPLPTSVASLCYYQLPITQCPMPHAPV